MPDTITLFTGRVLKSLRAEREMRLFDVAERTGYAMSTLSRWENGHACPRIDELDRVLGALGVTLVRFARRREALAPQLGDINAKPIAPA